MQYRTLGRTGCRVSAVGYGMWGLAGWSGSDDDESRQSLRLAVERGVDFFDTALAYGEGKSETLLGELVAECSDKPLYVATKVPPKNREWPSRRGTPLSEVFPADYIRKSAEESLARLGRIDLLQFHVWEDAWAQDLSWQTAVEELKRDGIIRHIGISINRWEPANSLATLRTGLIDTVQVIYNIFDQNPEDELFPVCRELNVGIIARVPFDEGSLTGVLTKDSVWPDGDWRNIYFTEKNLIPTVDRVEKLRPLVPAGMTMAEMAMRFVLSNPDVATVIPGMRKATHVKMNTDAIDPLPADLLHRLKDHRWDRTPTAWSN
ncbi:MAG: aldo/keto reductase [Gemmataceae bacterium]|nr:aldo/keto reductase [Gemmataceae bacterium]